MLTPWTLYERFGDTGILAQQFESARAWVDLVDRLSGEDHVWDDGFQLGDWLDPTAPPEDPAAGTTDKYLVATAYFAWSAAHLALSAEALGREQDAGHYRSLADRVRQGFAGRYVRPVGTLTSDSETAYALAIRFGLMPPDQLPAAAARLVELVAQSGGRIGTGFAGTPVIADALTMVGATSTAYELLLQKQCPSWLYAVTMGATTIWERWDSLLPDGTINPGQMTSFNHYAFGAVADWAPPGRRRARTRGAGVQGNPVPASPRPRDHLRLRSSRKPVRDRGDILAPLRGPNLRGRHSAHRVDCRPRPRGRQPRCPRARLALGCSRVRSPALVPRPAPVPKLALGQRGLVPALRRGAHLARGARPQLLRDFPRSSRSTFARAPRRPLHLQEPLPLNCGRPLAWSF